jgi:hypothetical protein
VFSGWLCGPTGFCRKAGPRGERSIEIGFGGVLVLMLVFGDGDGDGCDGI